MSDEYSSNELDMPGILHIDDDPEARKDLRLAAHEMFTTGTNLYQFARGDQAISYIRADSKYRNRGTFQVVLLDWFLPYRSGRSVLEALLAQPDFDGSIIVLASMRTLQLQREIQTLGPITVLAKPESIIAYYTLLRLLSQREET